MDGTAGLIAQCDPRAIELWNRYADHKISSDEFKELVEILRQDFPTFCGLCLKVRPKGGGYTIAFVFNQVQARMWREMCKRMMNGEPCWFVILKFRQAGMSTFWCAWLFWQMWRQRDIQQMVVAHQLPTAETMIETMRVFFDELPNDFKPELRDGNHGSTIPRGEVYFADRRSFTMIHLAKNLDPRGQSVTHVLETEYASYPDPDTLNAALKPQLPTFGSDARKRSSFIVESTPKGQNEFYDLYMDAKNRTMVDMHAMFYPWFLFDEQYAATIPEDFKLDKEERKERDRLSRMRKFDYSPEDGGGVEVSLEQMYWRRETIASDYRGDIDKFDQEYPSDDKTCWLLESKSVFREHSRELLSMVDEARVHAKKAWSKVMVDGKPVSTNGPVKVRLKPTLLNKGTWTPIEKVEFDVHPHGKWKIWEPPVSGHKYVIGGDPAMGLEGSDNSVCEIIDVTVARHVAEFCDQMGPEHMAVEMAAAGYWYNQALLVPEINSIGFVLLSHLIAHLTYPNLYRWPKFDEVNRYTHKRGFETNSRTKQLLVSSFIHYIEEGLLTIASEDLLAEMSTFERKNEGDYYSFAAQKGRRDDRVMAFGLAIMGIDQTPVLVTELQRSSRLPNARDLHLAATVDIQDTPLPQKIADMVKVKHTIPWNPISGDPF